MRRDSSFMLNLSDVIFLRTAPHRGFGSRLERTSAAIQSTCILVSCGNQVTAGKIEKLWVIRTKRFHTSREKWITTTVCRTERHQRSAAEKQTDYPMRGRIMFSMSISALSLWYHLFSQKSKEREFGPSAKVTM